MKRPRLRKWAKWVCTLAAVLAVSVAVFSRFDLCNCRFANSDGTIRRSVQECRGLMWLTHTDFPPGPSISLPTTWQVYPSPGWYWGIAGEVSPAAPQWNWRAGLLWERSAHGWALGMSLVYPVLFAAAPAAFLWYKDRRLPGPHACKKCGYDRRGISADTKCPECGAIPSAPNPPAPCPP